MILLKKECDFMSLEQILKDTFKGETTEVGWYLAMSKVAEHEGLADIAVYLRQIAMDEAWHATEVAEILGLVKETTLENLEMMLEGESKAEIEKAEAAELSRKEGNTRAALFFERASLDEARHKAGLNGFLKRLKNQQ
jgi:rubrerythrin